MKLKAKTKKAIRGSITLLMVIILLPMMTFSAMIVDTSRINMAKAMMSGAGDLTMNTALANYDTILKDVYGLFAMSQGKSEAELAEELKTYFADTIAGYGVVSKAEAGDYVENLIGDFNQLISGTEQYQSNPQDFLELKNLNVTVDRVDASALSSPSILRNQIVEYMKFRAPLELGMSFFDALKSFDVADEQMDVVESQVIAQEDTQDVTGACRALIKLIREYDDLVKTDNTEIKGWDKSTDTVTVLLKNYPTHVNKYLSSWEENYTHINKLLMVFLAKSPSVDSVYLVKQDYLSNVYFIKSSTQNGVVYYSVNYDNSGINISVSKKSQTEQAKQDVLNQINLLNGQKNIANTYTNKHFLEKGHMNDAYTAFANETTAINAFVGYEQFLKDQHSDVKYSSIANVLEDIYELGKLYDHYDGKIAAEITTAYNNWQAAKNEVTRINGVIENNKTAIDGYRSDINTLLSNYWDTGTNKEVKCLASYKTIQGSTKTLLRTQLPTVANYETYYDNTLMYGSTDQYLSQFKTIANNVAKSGKGNDKLIAAAAKQYIDNKVSNNFATYIKNQTKNSIKKTDPTKTEIFMLLDCLLSCSKKAQSIKSACTQYAQEVSNKTRAETDVATKKGVYDNKVKERKDIKNAYSICLGGFSEFSKAYQRDAYYYGKYIETATNIVNRETAAIKTQFGTIVSNISELKGKLDAIVTQCGTVKDKIVLYLESVDTWEDEVEAYEKANGQDSFSKQARQDIATARSTYDEASVETLKEFVAYTRDTYQNFLTYLSGDVYFKYGGLRLHEIGSAADALTAAKNNIASISAEIVTTQIADTSLTQLYKSGPGSDFVPYTLEATHYTDEQKKTGTADEHGQICFLEPEVIFIKFLKYLNSAYPETKPNTKVPDKDGKDVDPEADYNATKNDLKSPDQSIDNMGEEKTSDTDDKKDDKNKDKDEGGDKGETKPKTDKYGYSYKNVTISEAEKNALPSKTNSGKENKNGAFALKEENGKVDASGSVGDQKTAMNGVLAGLGSALTAGIENAYILTYMFENFSYNTMIQDAVMKGEEDSLKSSDVSVASLTKAKGLLKDTKVMEKYVGKQQTLSNVAKNAYNNHFYGAEVEYILYGNTSPAKNVSYSKASIYAIRFAFNCIFAFTDTEIRNSTMAAGLAVQAATLGIVPYQVVQIVLQLALAAAESAVDLDMMMTGLDVVVIKTKDTWTLSVSNAVKSAGAFVAETAADYAGKAVDKAAGGLQAVLDAGADKINDSVEDLKKDLENTADQAVKDIADQIFGVMITDLEMLLNDMQYVEQDIINNQFGNGVDSFGKYVDSKFTELETSLKTKLQDQFGGNELTAKVLNTITTKATDKGKSIFNDLLDEVKTKVKGYANSLAPSQAVDAVIANINSIKMSMVNTVTNAVTRITTDLSGIAKTAVADVHTQLSNILAENADELKEGITTKVTQGITDATDKFVNKYLGDAVGSVNSSGVSSGSSSLASLIKFGYKEYLMLFVYIGICANGDALLTRTADLIQLNLCKAGADASFSHNKGKDFRMKNACAYISLTAEAELDMFFMDLDLFASVLEEPAESSEDSEVTVKASETGTKLVYRGLLGY